MKDKSQHKQSIVAIDTNAFITMSRLDENFSSKHGAKFGFKQSCRDIKRMAANEHVKFIITPTVYFEIKQGWAKEGFTTQKEKDFLEKYCFVYEPKNADAYARKVSALAYQYIQKNAMNNDGGKPMRDALIMAEATILGLSLITNNVRDFTNYNPSRKQASGKRMSDIQHINEARNYSYYIEGIKFVPAPYTSFQFLELFRNNYFAPHDGMCEALKSASFGENAQDVQLPVVSLWDYFYVQTLNF